MNIFIQPEVAGKYEQFYLSERGKQIDILEKRLIDSLIKDINPCTMLEVGCGTGHWSEFFSKKGFTVIGVDSSKAMLDIAIKKNIANCTFINADAGNLPFNDETFNFVAAITLLEFVDEPEKVIEELYRVLCNYGYLLIGCLNKNSAISLKKEIDDIYKNATLYSKSELLKILKKFKIIKIKDEVYLDENFSISNKTQFEGAFIGILAQKISIIKAFP